MKSWRDVIHVHPAADLFPLMGKDELRALGEDIRAHGLLIAPVIWQEDPETPLFLLDGRNRLDAMELIGLPMLNDEGTNLNLDIAFRCRQYDGIDPYAFVLSANVHRRHLTAEQKRDLIAKVLKAQPGKSNRRIAAEVKVSDKTVGSIRADLERRAEIPHVSTVTDTKGRQQPASRPVTVRINEAKSLVEPVHYKLVADKPGPMSVTPPCELKVDRPSPPGDSEPDLSPTAQQRLEAAVRAHKRKLDHEFWTAVSKECRKHVEELSIPAYFEYLKKVEDMLTWRSRAVMTVKELNVLLRCVHPDQRGNRTEADLDEAWHILDRHKLKLGDNKEERENERRRLRSTLPQTVEELLARRKVKAPLTDEEIPAFLKH